MVDWDVCSRVGGRGVVLNEGFGHTAESDPLQLQFQWATLYTASSMMVSSG